MRRFYLQRNKDNSGVSGTGPVADGCLFPNGKVALNWRGKVPSWGLFDTLDEMLSVHGHNGDTVPVFLDPEEAKPFWNTGCTRV